VASVLHRGPYEALPKALDELHGWASRAGHEAAGGLRVLYLQFGAEPDLRLPAAWTVDRDDEFVTELQLPVG
jgi:effector-binding domain-containing protein